MQGTENAGANLNTSQDVSTRDEGGCSDRFRIAYERAYSIDFQLRRLNCSKRFS